MHLNDLRTKYYVYVLEDPRKPGPYAAGPYLFTHQPFYIGKGEGYRKRVHLTDARRVLKEGREDELHSVEDAKLIRIIEIFKSGDWPHEEIEPVTEIVREGMTEFQAFEFEADMIRTIGRKIYGGLLLNEDDGHQYQGPPPIKSDMSHGMNNVINGETFQDDRPTVVPHVILNADVGTSGQVRKRDGRKLRIPLPGARSLFACPLCMLAVAKNKLYYVFGGQPHEICAVDGPENSMIYYAEFRGKIFISSKHWNGVFDPITHEVSPWSVPTPSSPMAFPVPGGTLSPGRYKVCLATALGDGVLYGGASPWSVIDLPEGDGGIEIAGRQPSDIVFCTDPDGDTFYRIGQQDTITHISTADPLLTLHAGPSPHLVHIQAAWGRMWGASGSRLIYSYPLRPDLVGFDGYFEMSGCGSADIKMIAPISLAPAAGGPSVGGIYVGTSEKVVFLTGTSPEAMVQREVGQGVVEGSLVYCNGIPEMGDNVPAWVSQDGIMAGTPYGDLRNLTRERIQFKAGDVGASMFTMRKGFPQFITNFKRDRPGGTSAGANWGDNTTCEVIRKGKVIEEENS